MKIILNNIEYEINEVSQEEYKKYKKDEDKRLACEEVDTSKGVYFGASHYATNKIFIDKDLPIDRKKKVLLHELAHCYIGEYITHEEKQYNEEDVADIISNSFYIIKNIIEKYFKEK